MNKNKILDFFKEENLSNRYINLCKKFSNFDDAISPKKNEILKLLKKHELDLVYSRADSIFYEDFDIGQYEFRFLLTYKYGIIGSTYMISDKEKSIFRKNLANITSEIDDSFEELFEYRYPMSTSFEDLEEILDEIFTIYKSFKKKFN